ncbi:unnamed protein product [Amoebophrya sp. A120]|nr:unnamed protein product [Amoebophrya sp. A120]|eukprot:GSA120T00006553001.1
MSRGQTSLVVKNTFLDLDGSAKAPFPELDDDIPRANTAPVRRTSSSAYRGEEDLPPRLYKIEEQAVYRQRSSEQENIPYRQRTTDTVAAYRQRTAESSIPYRQRTAESAGGVPRYITRDPFDDPQAGSWSPLWHGAGGTPPAGAAGGYPALSEQHQQIDMNSYPASAYFQPQSAAQQGGYGMSAYDTYHSGGNPMSGMLDNTAPQSSQPYPANLAYSNLASAIEHQQRSRFGSTASVIPPPGMMISVRARDLYALLQFVQAATGLGTPAAAAPMNPDGAAAASELDTEGKTRAAISAILNALTNSGSVPAPGLYGGHTARPSADSIRLGEEFLLQNHGHEPLHLESQPGLGRPVVLGTTTSAATDTPGAARVSFASNSMQTDGGGSNNNNVIDMSSPLNHTASLPPPRTSSGQHSQHQQPPTSFSARAGGTYSAWEVVNTAGNGQSVYNTPVPQQYYNTPVGSGNNGGNNNPSFPSSDQYEYHDVHTPFFPPQPPPIGMGSGGAAHGGKANNNWVYDPEPRTSGTSTGGMNKGSSAGGANPYVPHYRGGKGMGGGHPHTTTGTSSKSRRSGGASDQHNQRGSGYDEDLHARTLLPESELMQTTNLKPSQVDYTIPATPHALRRQTSINSGAHRVTWNVEAKRLKSTDKLCVSPAFSVLQIEDVKYRIVLYPPETGNYSKGQGNFRSSKGKGRIVLKCDTAMGDVEEVGSKFQLSFRFFVGGPDKKPKISGPMTNDFTELNTKGLPKAEEWDFLQHAERGNLLVGVEARQASFTSTQLPLYPDSWLTPLERQRSTASAVSNPPEMMETNLKDKRDQSSSSSASNGNETSKRKKKSSTTASDQVVPQPPDEEKQAGAPEETTTNTGIESNGKHVVYKEGVHQQQDCVESSQYYERGECDADVSRHAVEPLPIHLGVPFHSPDDIFLECERQESYTNVHKYKGKHGASSKDRGKKFSADYTHTPTPRRDNKIQFTTTAARRGTGRRTTSSLGSTTVMMKTTNSSGQQQHNHIDPREQARTKVPPNNKSHSKGYSPRVGINGKSNSTLRGTTSRKGCDYGKLNAPQSSSTGDCSTSDQSPNDPSPESYEYDPGNGFGHPRDYIVSPEHRKNANIPAHVC